MIAALALSVASALAALAWALLLRARLRARESGVHGRSPERRTDGRNGAERTDAGRSLKGIPEDTVAASISRHSVVGTAILDSENRLVWVNDALCDFFWLARREVLGQPFLPLIESKLSGAFEDPEAVFRRVRESLGETRAEAPTFECRLLERGPRPERWLKYRSQPITHGPLAGGRIEQWAEITEEVRARELLDRSGQRLQELNRILVDLATRTSLGEGDLSDSFREITEVGARTLDVDRVGVWLFNDHGSELYCAHQYVRAEDRHEEPDLALDVTRYPRYFSAAETTRVIAAEDMAADPRTAELDEYGEQEGVTALLDAPIRIKGELAGLVCHEYGRGTRLWTPEEQQFAASIADFTSQAMEVAEQRAAEQKLLVTRARTAEILDGISDAFFHLDEDWRFTYLNKRARSWLATQGLSGAALLGRRIWDAFDTPEDDPGRRAFRKARATGTPTTFVRYNELFQRWFESHVSPSIDGLAVYVRDITDQKQAEEALKESETRFRNVVEALGEGLVISEPGGAIMYINPRMEELTGFKAQEVTGESSIDVFVPPEWRDRVRSELENRRRGESNRYQMPLLRKGGSRFWAEIHSRPMLDADGNISAVVGAVADITERRRAEEALRTSEERFRVLVERAPEAIVVLDPDSNEILDLNQNFVRLFGRTRVELLEIFPPELSPEFQPDGRSSREAAEDYMGRAMEGGNPVFEWIHLHADGHEIPCEVRLSRLPWDDRIVIRGSLTDITERKEAEQALRRSEERYRALFEDDVAGNYVSSVEGFIVNCNDAFARTMGFEGAGAAIGQPVVPTLVSEEGRREFLDLVRREKALDYHETRGHTVDGEPVHLMENVRGIFDDDGNLVEVHGHVIDVTHKKSLEEQLRQAQKMEAIGQLAGGVAHDFNNLLTAISGHTELLLLDPGVADAVKSDLRRIAGAAERATKLTAQLLAFSRRQVLQPEVLDLSDVVQGMDHILHRLLGEAIELTFTSPEDPVLVEADPNQVEQTLMNLAVNARDAMSGEGTIAVSIDRATVDAEVAGAHAGLDAGDYALLVVRDTGEGMDPDVMERIFEPFYTTKDPGKGTGLGLAMVYGFVHQSGGFVDVESAPGDGTTFTIYLPEADRDEGGAKAGDTMGDEAGASIGRSGPESSEVDGGFDARTSPARSETILFVEDQDDVRALGVRVLREHGYAVLEADEPRKALAHAEQWPEDIHLLVTDLRMPDMDGRALADEVSRLRPGIPVLYISGDGRTDGTVAAERTNLLSKPFSVSDLLRRVRATLDSPLAARSGTGDS